jgi:hypothetical protein
VRCSGARRALGSPTSCCTKAAKFMRSQSQAFPNLWGSNAKPFPKEALLVLWDFKGLQGSKSESDVSPNFVLQNGLNSSR